MELKTYSIPLIISLFVFFPLAAFSQDKTTTYTPSSYTSYNELQANKMTIGDINNDAKLDSSDIPLNNGDLIVAGNIGVGTKTPAQRLDVNGFVKGRDGLCIGENCKKSWPSLKCAEYDGRPKGETGDSYCNSIGKVCLAVFIGTGVSYFNECSTPVASLHKTRCCWVE